MSKVFVSVPMSGRTEEDVSIDIFNATFNYKDVSDDPKNLEFVDHWETSEVPPDVKHPNIWMLGEALQLMATCDDVTFGGDYENSRGCMIEKLVYLMYFPYAVVRKREENQ